MKRSTERKYNRLETASTTVAAMEIKHSPPGSPTPRRLQRYPSIRPAMGFRK
jgi:hypothetical protein